jgi:hypothetical protein
MGAAVGTSRGITRLAAAQLLQVGTIKLVWYACAAADIVLQACCC